MASAENDVDWRSTKRTVLERNRHMLNNSDMSDISFMCEGSDRKFHAHKYVLATASSVFHAMFYGVLAERDTTITLGDTDDKSFEELLKFVYTDECSVTADNAGSIMYLSKKYMVDCLTERCVDVLLDGMKAENVLSALELAVCFEQKELEVSCWHFVERYTSDVVSSESFGNITQTRLITLLNRKNLDIAEVKLFQAMVRWSEVQCGEKNLPSTSENKRSVIGDAIYAIKYLTMTQQEFAQNVSTSGLFSTSELVPMYEQLNGLDSDVLEWALSRREPPLKTIELSDPTHPEFCRSIEFIRFGNIQHDAWKYDSWEPDRLNFTVSKTVLFHGTRLFGNLKQGSKYVVTLDIKGARVSGTHTLERDGLSGFDVLLESPIVIEANEVVTLTARIKGPTSYMGLNGKEMVRRFYPDCIVVRFFNAPYPNHGTSASQGQFYNIILTV